MTDAPAIELNDLAKTYRGKVHALRGVSMRVERGQIFGLLGPNGAGKSTLVKILMTVVRPTRCRGRMLGAPIGRNAALARVGYLPEHHRFPDYLTGEQVLDYYGALADVPRRDRRKRRGELLELVGMSDWASKRVRSFSKGMRQRLGIANALVNDPELVLLDEPTDGVDPVGRRDIRNILIRMRGEGRTVLLNSHLLSELEMVCDRVAILVQGLVKTQGTLDELTADSRRYEIECDAGADVRSALRRLAPPAEGGQPGANGARGEQIGTLASGESLELRDHVLRVATNEAAAVQPIIDALRAGGVVIRAVRPVRPSLEDLFMSAVTDPETGRAAPPGARTDAKAPARTKADR